MRGGVLLWSRESRFAFAAISQNVSIFDLHSRVRNFLDFCATLHG
jgi:hypothetical protein